MKSNDIPLISIIVSVYNVKLWIKRCLDSLKNQTLKEIEIICIDDGSTDGSDNLIDQYKNDTRFRIIHTRNRGLSSTRNQGIDESKSEYIMFVDGDDWVDKRFCEIPYRIALANNSDLVIFDFYSEKNGKIRRSKKEKFLCNGVVDFETAIEKGGTAAWRRLYKKKLFDKIRYPKGHVYEDIATTYKIVHEAKLISIIPNKLYYHLERKNGISHSRLAAYQKDRFYYSLERYYDLLSYGYPEEKLKKSLCASSIRFLSSPASSDCELYSVAKKVLDSMETIPDSLSLRQKLAFLVWKFDNRLFIILSRIFETFRV